MDGLIKKVCITTVVILIILCSGNQPVMAASPWQWEMTLQEVKSGPGMYLPSAVLIDAALERYYVVDSGRNRILTYDRSGNIYRDFDAGKQLATPYDLEREEGILWLVEKGKNSLTRIDLEAKKIFPKSLADGDRQLYPHRIEMQNGNIYLLDKASGKVFSLDKDLKIVRRFACSDCEGGFVDFKIRNGSLWALDLQGKKVYRFSMNSSLQTVVHLDPSEVDFPSSLEIDENNFLFILDRHQGSIMVFDGNGNFRYSFLESGQARGQLYYPIEIKFDPWGRLCVVDEGNGRVQVFSQR